MGVVSLMEISTMQDTVRSRFLNLFLLVSGIWLAAQFLRGHWGVILLLLHSFTENLKQEFNEFSLAL